MKIVNLLLLLSSYIQALTLEEYENQVKNQHPLWLSSEQNQGAAYEQKKIESLSAYLPSLLGEMKRDSEKENGYQASLQQMTPWGTRWSILGNLQENEEKNIKTGTWQVFIEQPLRRNAWGREIKEQVNTQVLGLELKKQAAQMSKRQLLQKIRSTFWALASSQKILKLQTESYEDSEKLLLWKKKQAANHLADEEDVLTLETSLLLNQNALSDAKVAYLLWQKMFNQLRKTDGDPGEILYPLPEEFLEWTLSEVPPKSLEVEMAEMERRIAESQKFLSQERFTSSWNISAASAQIHMHSPMLPKTKEVNNWEVKLSWSIPIFTPDFAHSESASLENQALGAQNNFLGKTQEYEENWEVLRMNLYEAQKSWKLADKIEKSQKIRCSAEEERAKNGRSTTQQVFLCTQDRLKASIAKQMATDKILSSYTQARTYGENP